MLIHSRIQHPVGHGFFHSATISFNKSKFNYVYDCGGDQARKRVHHYLRTLDDGEIDALFISHLHADHVNALDQLLPDVQLKSVFLPYISNTELILLAIESLASGESDSVYLTFLQDPVQWLKNRGAQQVTEIRGGPTGETPFHEALVLPPGGENEREQPTRLSIVPYPPDLNFLDSHGGTSALKEPGIRSHDRIIDHRLGFTLVSNQRPVWLLIPFVQQAPQDGLNRFLQELRKTISNSQDRLLLRMSHQHRFWKEALANSDFRTKLRYAYQKVHTDFNRTSLCLYSGCGQLPDKRIEYHVRFPMKLPAFPYASEFCCAHFPRCNYRPENYAWLGTGDAALNDRHVLKSLQQHYSGLFDTIHTLCLPHHGSRYNTGPELLRLINPIVAISACRQSDPSHPHPSVIDEVVGQGCTPIQVTANEETQFEERVVIKEN